jgi:K+-transporting ATPase KdpF subunit
VRTVMLLVSAVIAGLLLLYLFYALLKPDKLG